VLKREDNNLAVPVVDAINFVLPQFANLVSNLLQSGSHFAPPPKQLFSFLQKVVELTLELLKMLDLALVFGRSINSNRNSSSSAIR
jgi:hypothetical protein